MTKVLIAPVTITPTKALTPSHLKGLLWVDVMYRATSLLADVTYNYSVTTYNTTAQTMGFWEHLDRTFGDIDYSAHTEEEIGELYVRYNQRAEPVRYEALRPYRQAVEDSGWVHPASARLLDLWSTHYRTLGMHDPGLTAVRPPWLTLAELVDLLQAHELCLDHRSTGGPLYLDATRYGLPLRPVVTHEDHPNYLTGALRELVPLAAEHDETVLVHDPELTADYVLLQKVLESLGNNVVRAVVDRVPIDGAVLSSRHGGWQGYTLGAMLSACGEVEAEVLRLGMRLYFIAVLGKGGTQSFRHDQLHQSMARARKLLATSGDRLDPASLAEYVGRHRRKVNHVDPYRVTTALLARHARPPVRDLVERVYV